MIQTELISYPCPVCGQYYLPQYHETCGKAVMVCPKDGLFKTSVAVSLNFRKFCKKLGSAPNRSPTYYTSHEALVKKVLLDQGMREGLDFWHNVRVQNRHSEGKAKIVTYWLDFVIPSWNTVLEVSPTIWHKMWARDKSDERKRRFITSLGWRYIELDEGDLSGVQEVSLRILDVGIFDE